MGILLWREPDKSGSKSLFLTEEKPFEKPIPCHSGQAPVGTTFGTSTQKTRLLLFQRRQSLIGCRSIFMWVVWNTPCSTFFILGSGTKFFTTVDWFTQKSRFKNSIIKE